MKHDEIRELLGAYAVNAVDGDERRAVEDHLDTCEACAVEVLDHYDTASHLGDDPAPPPARVWQSIAEEIAGGTQPATPPFPLRARPAQPRRWQVTTTLAVAAALALALVAGVTVARLRDAESERDRLAAALTTVDAERAARSALLDPRSRQVDLRSPDEGTVARLVVLPSGTGYVVEHNLDPLGEGLTYQLWAIEGEAVVSAGVLGRNPEVAPFTAPVGTDGFAITAEKAPGVAASEHDPVVVGFV